MTHVASRFYQQLALVNVGAEVIMDVVELCHVRQVKDLGHTHWSLLGRDGHLVNPFSEGYTYNDCPTYTNPLPAPLPILNATIHLDLSCYLYCTLNTFVDVDITTRQKSLAT